MLYLLLKIFKPLKYTGCDKKFAQSDKKICTKWQKNLHKVTKKFSQNDKKFFTKWQKNLHKMTKKFTQNNKKIFTKWQKNLHKMTKKFSQSDKKYTENILKISVKICRNIGSIN